MLSLSDILHLPYTPDLTESGISYACRSLACSYNRVGRSPFSPLRRMVAGVAVDLAFRRYLGEQSIPFAVQGAAPFTGRDHYDVSLGGYRCVLESYLISHSEQIARLGQDPALILQAPALLPLDEFASEVLKPDDLYLFAFILGRVAPARREVDKALADGRPVYLIQPLPDAWARPSKWVPLEKLSLKSDCAAPLVVEIGGQNARREFVTARLELPPKKNVLLSQSFYSLAYIHTARPPEAGLRLQSPAYAEACTIPPGSWGNIWVDGTEILLTGWLSHQEFRRRASLLNAGMATFQFSRTRVKNLLVPVAGLNPLGELFEKAHAWKAQKSPN